MHDLFLTGYGSVLAVTLITIVGAMMVHVFCPGGCLWTNAMARFARLIFRFCGRRKNGLRPQKRPDFQASSFVFA